MSNASYMQEKGLEPSWYCYHTDLNRARLPIPPLLRTKHIVYVLFEIVNSNFSYFANNLKKYKICYSSAASVGSSTMVSKSTIFHSPSSFA